MCIQRIWKKKISYSEIQAWITEQHIKKNNLINQINAAEYHGLTAHLLPVCHIHTDFHFKRVLK